MCSDKNTVNRLRQESEMDKLKVNVVAALVTFYTGISAGPVLATQDIDVLPEANSGECYAKVLVPPVYKTDSIEVIVTEATEKQEIIPAAYTTSTERVKIKEEFNRLTAIQPQFETKQKKIQIAAAETKWVRDGLDGKIDVSAGTLADLRSSGVNVNGVTPGQCFYEHYKPAEYKETEEKVLIAAASETLSIEEAQFSETEKRVMVKAASKRLIEVPAVFKTVEDKVLIEPAKSVWKKGTGPIMRIDNATGEIMCRIDIPAVYETYKRKAVAAPPLTTTVVVPAEFESVKIATVSDPTREVRTPVPAKFDTITKTERVSSSSIKWIAGSADTTGLNGKHTGEVVCFTEQAAKFATVDQKVIKTPGSFTSTTVPAVFENIPVRKLVSDARVSKTTVPAIKKDYIKRVKVSDARLEWRPVLCETNTTEDTVSTIQQALADAGFNPGTIDGVLGRGTLDAIEEYQKSKNLAQGGITYDTLEALGVEL